MPVTRLAAWSLGTGIVATVGANLSRGVGHGPVGALVSAWPALALTGSFGLLMMLIRTELRPAPRPRACFAPGPGPDRDQPRTVKLALRLAGVPICTW